jgi:hypothetical protein
MDSLPFFVAQLAWLLLVWSALVGLVVWPWSRRLARHSRLALWIAPQMFRVLGLGLLVPALSPGMPRDFAVSTAVGDSLTATLALLAFVGLRRAWRPAVALAWACTAVGSIDLLIAFSHALRAGVIGHLAAQWFVPVVAGPVMVVAHAACLVELVQGARRTRVGPSS